MIQGTFVFIVCSILTLLLSTPVAFLASGGRGYLSPWSIPALASGVAGSAIIEGSIETNTLIDEVFPINFIWTANLNYQ